jgi:hypothetical protein
MPKTQILRRKLFVSALAAGSAAILPQTTVSASSECQGPTMPALLNQTLYGLNWALDDGDFVAAADFFTDAASIRSPRVLISGRRQIAAHFAENAGQYSGNATVTLNAYGLPGKDGAWHVRSHLMIYRASRQNEHNPPPQLFAHQRLLDIFVEVRPNTWKIASRRVLSALTIMSPW